MKAERSTTIARPPGEVFEFVSDPRNLPKWQPAVSEVTLHGDEVSVGARFEESRQFVGKRFRSTVEVTELEPGTRVSKEQFEMLEAHRRLLLQGQGATFDETLQLLGRILLVLAMVMASVFYIRLEDRETMQSNGRLALLALVVIINLALVRITYSLGSLPFFLGLAIVVPLLGHASWHLYRKVVER